MTILSIVVLIGMFLFGIWVSKPVDKWIKKIIKKI